MILAGHCSFRCHLFGKIMLPNQHLIIFCLFCLLLIQLLRACWQYPAKLQFNAFTQNQATLHQYEVNNCDSFIEKKKKQKTEWEQEYEEDNDNERNSYKREKKICLISHKYSYAHSVTHRYTAYRKNAKNSIFSPPISRLLWVRKALRTNMWYAHNNGSHAVGRH